VYRFLLTPRWLGLALLTVLLAATMVLLGNWQLDRYHLRSSINARIDAAATAAPVPLTDVAPAPAGPAGTAGPAPPDSAAWSRVRITGRYDSGHEILARARTVDGRVGYEVVTPLVLADGSAVLVDRGWLPPNRAGASAAPAVPPAPPGDVSVVGRVHQSESGGTGPVERNGGYLGVRRIAVPHLAPELPYRLFGAYVLLDSQDPPAAAELTPVPSRRENAWQNGGYVVQWWLFAALTMVGFGWLARREAREPAEFEAALRDLANEHSGDEHPARLPQAPVSPAV
jgi:cytochrome oxidase assembly protein ShyY1